jgi:hypothetical protein
LAALLFAAPAAKAALITITSLDGDGADHYVTEGSPTSTPNRDHRLFVRTSSTNGHQVTYIRFDLSSITDPIQSVAFELAQLTTGAFTLNLYGLNDHSSETSLWLEDTITYNTAPGMGTPDGNNTTSDLDLSKVTSLGSFSMGSFTSPPAVTRSMNAAAITSFLQNDTNGLVTFVLETTSSGTNQFRSSRDRSSGDAFLAGEHPPRIVVTTVPEPGTYVLATIGLIGLGVMRLRNRS